MTEEQTRSHIARDGREVRTVVAVEDILRTGCTHCRHQRIIMVHMAAEKIVRSLVDMPLLNDLREILVGIAYSRAERNDLAAAGPVAQTDRHTVRIVLLQTIDILLIPTYIRLTLLAVCITHTPARVNSTQE